MADNTTLNTMTGGDVYRSKDRSSVKTSIVALDLDPSGSETLMAGKMPVGGDVAHDTADSGNPVKVGAKAVAHGTNPTAVAAADRTDLLANRHGQLFIIGGHPNTITRTVRIADADGAQTNASIAGTVATGTKVVITRLSAFVSNACTVNVRVKVGFGTSTLPADSTSGANGILADQVCPPGGGFVIGNGAGIVGVGADDEELRLTCDDPVTGHVTVSFSFFTIES